MALGQQILIILAVVGGLSIIGACVYGVAYIYKEWDEFKTEVTRLNFLRGRIIKLEEGLEELKLKRAGRKRK